MVSQLFDPIGLQAPYTHQGRNIPQKVNQSAVDWDDHVTQELEKTWKQWSSQLAQLQVEIPLCLDAAAASVYELHTFSDASLDGIGACSYLRAVDEQGKAFTNLMPAKSRVVLSKGPTTVPRLELQGSLLAIQLSSTLVKELHLDRAQKYFWCDSRMASHSWPI